MKTYNTNGQSVLPNYIPRVGDKDMTSRADIIAAIRGVADELGETPTAAQFEEHTEYSRSQAQHRFDSWNNAIKSAGLEPNREFHSDAKLIWILEDLGEELGRTPSRQDFRDHAEISLGAIVNRFGSWNEALRLAGFEINQEAELDRELLAESFRELEAELGKVPSQKDMWKHGPHSPKSYQQRWGSWQAAKDALSQRQA